MSIWNPFAFTPTGQAMAPVAPPALRVIGGQATAQQLTHAQDAFYRFCASTRLSAVPNPVETGRLPDGTQYRIVKVGPQTTMEIWPGGGEAQKVFSGILFLPSKTLLVNDGKMDAPSKKWRVVDVSSIPIDSSYYSGALQKRLTVSRSTPGSGQGQYFYGFGSFGRYGNAAAHYFGNPNLGSSGTAGMAQDGRVDLFNYSTATRQLQIFRSVDTELHKTLPPYGVQPTPTIMQLAPAEILVAANTTSAITVGPTASKRGNRICFAVDYYEPIVIGVDYVLGQPLTLETPHQFLGSVSSGGLIWAASPSVLYDWRYKQTGASQIKESRREGGVFQAPQTTKTIPLPTINPPTTFGAVTVSGGAVRYSPSISSFVMRDISHPRHVCTSIYDIHRTEYDTSDELDYKMNSSATGPITFSLERTESIAAVRSLEYTGVEQIVPAIERKTFSYLQSVSGSMSFERVYAVSGDEVPPGGPPSIKVGDFNPLGDEISHADTYGASSIITLVQESVLLLGGDERQFVEHKETYSETSSFSSSRSTSDPGYINLDNSSYSADINYTLVKEKRDLLLFDPAWDLMCYTERVTTVQRTAHTERTVTHSGTTPTITESNSGGGPLPPEPQKYIVLNFRGAETRFSIPFLAPDHVADAALRRNALRTLCPATGIAPGNAPNGSFDTIGGFYGFDINMAAAMDGAVKNAPRVLNIFNAPPTEEIVVSAQALDFRGLSPAIYVGEINPEITYTKTPETGAALLTIYFNRRGTEIRKRYLFDAAGMRDADAVVAGIPVTGGVVESPRGPF